LPHYAAIKPSTIKVKQINCIQLVNEMVVVFSFAAVPVEIKGEPVKLNITMQCNPTRQLGGC